MLASCVLAFLIALEAAHILLVLFAPDIDTRAPGVRAPIPARQGPRVDVDSIVAKHLFGVAEADPNTQAPSDAGPSTANFLLVGVIAIHDPRGGVAIISEAGGPSKVYSVGDQVGGGASLHSVYLTYVLLERSGLLERLVLPNRLSAGERPPRSDGRGTRGGKRISPPDDDPRRQAERPPGDIADIVQFSPGFLSRAGKSSGIRVYPGTYRTAFNAFGMHLGDLVTAINGTPFLDQQTARQLLDSIQSSGAATLTVDRNGETHEIKIDVASRNSADAAADAPATE